MTRKQTLSQAVEIVRAGKSRAMKSAAVCLSGKPAGGWPETQQALRELANELPVRQLRDYTINDFVAAVYELDSADRYRSRFEARS